LSAIAREKISEYGQIRLSGKGVTSKEKRKRRTNVEAQRVETRINPRLSANLEAFQGFSVQTK
jgi:hypothetical protein